MDNFLFLPRALSSALFDIAFAGALGSLVARLLLNNAFSSHKTSARLEELLRKMLLSCAVTMLFLSAVQPWLLTATMIGSSSFLDVRQQLYDVLTGTHAGRVLILQALFLIPLLLISALRRAINKIGYVYIGLFLMSALTCARAASGHAAGQGDFTLQEAMQVVHLASIAIWAGGVIVAGLIVLPAMLHSQKWNNPMSEVSYYGHSLSTTSTWAVMLVVLSGTYNGWLGLGGSLKPLEHTQWGIILLVKSSLVIIALAIGAKNRLLLRRHTVFSQTEVQSLSRWLRIEAIVMIAVLMLSGFLANSPPVMNS